MTIEKFDRDKAQAHLDSHEDAMVFHRENCLPIWHVKFYGDKFNVSWEEMRLAYITDTPPLPEQTMLSSTPQTAEQPGTDPDGWIPWHGGECPVSEGTLVDVRYRDGDENIGVSAGLLPSSSGWVKGSANFWAFEWRHRDNNGDIIAYRLHREPEDRLTQLERRIEALEQKVNGGE